MTSSDRISTIGMVGLGAMGLPIARRLAAGPFTVLGYDLRPVEELGAVLQVDQLAEVGAADLVFVIVPTDGDVRSVVAGAGGLIETGHEGLVIVVSSSVQPTTCQELAARALEVGIHVIDAPLTGGVSGAVDGKLNLLVGGDEVVVDRADEVLRAVGESYHRLGPVGAGQIGKTVNNLVHWAEIVAIDEALRFGALFGVDPVAMRTALQDGPVDGRTLRELERMRFTWYVKDIDNAVALAEEQGVGLPVAELSKELMHRITVPSMKEMLRY